jgi:hypothetical protein
MGLVEPAVFPAAFPAKRTAVPIHTKCKTIHHKPVCFLSTLSAKEKDSGERIKPAALCGGREKSPVDSPAGLPTLLRIITIAQYFFLCNKPLGKPSSKPPSKPVSKPSRKTLSANTHKHWIPAYPALEKMSSGTGKTFFKKFFLF